MMMDTASAELCKYAANSILATRISFMNEIANVCELVGADVDQVRRGDRLGSPHRQLLPVPGRRLRRQLLSEGRQGAAQVVRATRATTSRSFAPSKRSTTRRNRGSSPRCSSISATCAAGRSPRGASRSSRAPTTCARRRRSRSSSDLLEQGATRPRLRSGGSETAARGIFGGRITLCEKSYDALDGADALAVVTEWNEFREPDFKRMRQLLKSPVVFDGRNIYSPEQMRALGFTYFSIGR